MAEKSSRKPRQLKVYKNPHTGERVETKDGNHKTLKEWKSHYGSDEVENWLANKSSEKWMCLSRRPSPLHTRFKYGQSYLSALRPPHQVQLLEPDGHRRVRDTELLGQ